MVECKLGDVIEMMIFPKVKFLKIITSVKMFTNNDSDNSDDCDESPF